MIDPRRQYDQIVLFQPDPHPLVPFTPDIEIPRPVANVPDLLVFVQVLVEEGFHFGLVHLAHGGGADGDFVAVLVVAVRRKGVDGREGGVGGVEDAEGGEVGGGDGAVGVVGETLVALFGGEGVSWAGWKGGGGGVVCYLDVVVPVGFHGDGGRVLVVA